MWGSWWNWDPRESSYLLLVFLYAAYLFLRAAVDDPERRARIAAAYALFAAVLMPFLVFVAPRVTASLHPQTVINPQGKILMDTPTRAVFFGALAGFSALFFWMLSLEARARGSRRGSSSGELTWSSGQEPLVHLDQPPHPVPGDSCTVAERRERLDREQPRVPGGGQRGHLGRVSFSTSGGSTGASPKRSANHEKGLLDRRGPHARLRRASA